MEENAVHLATALVLLGGVERDVTELNVGFTVSMGHAWGQMSVLAMLDGKERGVIMVCHVVAKLEPAH